MASQQHKTVPVQVWVDVDEGIADVVRYLNTLPGVRTLASCQGTLDEGGPETYGPQVMVSWTGADVLWRLAQEFSVEMLGERGLGLKASYPLPLRPRAQLAGWPALLLLSLALRLTDH